MEETFKILIRGQVQGVGFRPFVYNLAQNQQIKGTVSNNENGVIIYLNASEEKTRIFLDSILIGKPEVAVITESSFSKVGFQDFTEFGIIPSEKSSQINIPITPDFAICDSCKNEIATSDNKRYQYAFTTCVNCGPRYSITSDFPFERENTTIDSFPMCDSCQDEYKNPSNHRFHSQTNTCVQCGIQLVLVDKKGKKEMNQVYILKKIDSLLHEGKILAIKNTNGYLLCCDATNAESVLRLRKNKKRPNKPFAVIYPDIDKVIEDFHLSEIETEQLQSRIAPILLLQNKDRISIVREEISPGLDQTGVMLPSSALLQIILSNFSRPIVATSGNIHGSPIISDNNQAEDKLINVADYFIHHNLEINFPQDDSVMKYANQQRIIYRRSRGMAPNYINALAGNKTVLAMGADLKSTFCFVPNQQVYVSQYFGNLENYEVSKRYQETISNFLNLFDSKPEIILTDLHPQYQSAIYGKELAVDFNVPSKTIQHHKAHFACVLGEHKLFDEKQKVLGVIWDGTGLGEDQNIWGGEFFTYENYRIDRVNHFEYFDWLSNDKMSREPRLSLFSLITKRNEVLIKDKFSDQEWKILSHLKRKNSLKTSSVGRLFDAVASALDLIDINTFEAQAAILLETNAMQFSGQPKDLLENEIYKNIPSRILVDKVIELKKEGEVIEAIAYHFVFSLAKLIIREAQQQDVKIIACSGGVFQNALLVNILNQLIKKQNYVLKLNCNLSPNDENISFGQLMYYQNIKF